MPPVNAAMRCANFEERRDRAMALFAEKGFGQVSMRELAAHLGMTAGSLYHHFPSKQDLLYDLIEELYEELQATLAWPPRHGARGFGVGLPDCSALATACRTAPAVSPGRPGFLLPERSAANAPGVVAQAL
ncbi:TetR family transcriptional regulator [Pseudomonas putida]|uniref:TetR family transcriptional regulator n=1 Tax=Pseudomonas putida TaxID=303 RepID=A0A379KS29_PSEPU|nr:TetR family transcriptional regulator [Pseudomonas putida]